MKAMRQRRIAQLMNQVPVTSQEQLVDLLHAEGLDSTQATVSRDLEELGAVKVRRDGKMAYSLDSPVPTVNPDHLRRTLSLSVAGVEASGNIVVVKTPPGHAGMVASAIDRADLEGIAGTIAGDDTIMIVCSQSVPGKRVADKLKQLSESSPALGKNGDR